MHIHSKCWAQIWCIVTVSAKKFQGWSVFVDLSTIHQNINAIFMITQFTKDFCVVITDVDNDLLEAANVRTHMKTGCCGYSNVKIYKSNYVSILLRNILFAKWLSCHLSVAMMACKERDNIWNQAEDLACPTAIKPRDKYNISTYVGGRSQHEVLYFVSGCYRIEYIV